MEDLKIGDLVTYHLPAHRRAEHEESGWDSPWIKRTDEKHLCVVIDDQPGAYGDIRVWDTVEKTDWYSRPSNFSRVAK